MDKIFYCTCGTLLKSLIIVPGLSLCNNDPSNDDDTLTQTSSTIPNAHTKTLPSFLIESPMDKSTNTTNTNTADNKDPANNTTKTNPKEYDYAHGYASTNTTH